MIYQWSKGSRYSDNQASAQVVGERLRALEAANAGAPLDAAQVVEDARPDEAPLHGLFEWDDSVAGEAYRRVQARSVLRSIVVVSSELVAAAPVKAFVVIERGAEADAGGPRRGYVSLADAMANPTERAQILTQAYTELQAWVRRYRDLQEFARIYAAVEDVQLPFVGQDTDDMQPSA